MSIRAYLVKKEHMVVDNKVFTHREEEYAFNCWRQIKLFDKILEYGENYLNEDGVGTIIISRKIFINRVYSSFNNNATSNATRESLEFIKNNTRNEEWIEFECY